MNSIFQPPPTPSPTPTTPPPPPPPPHPLSSWLWIRSRFGLYLQLIRWDRPAGWLLLLWPTLSALWIANYSAERKLSWWLMVVFVLGTIIMRSAGCCINDVADREFDRHVKRTAQRPVTSGQVGVKEALGVGVVLALLAFGLVLTTNIATVLWSIFALMVAVIYPYSKRWFAMPQAVLGIAFSFGIPMAFAAVWGDLPWLQGMPWWWQAWHSVPSMAWWLLLGNLFWVLAYDTEYAMVDRDDDLHLGIKTSAITLGDWDVMAIMLFYGLHALIWTLTLWSWVHPMVWGMTLFGVLGQVIWHYRLIRDRERRACFKAFTRNHWLGMTFFIGIVVSSWIS